MLSFYSWRYKANQRNCDPCACLWRGREKKRRNDGEVCRSRWASVGQGGWARAAPTPARVPLQRSRAQCSAAFLRLRLPTVNAFSAEVMPRGFFSSLCSIKPTVGTRVGAGHPALNH